MWPYWIMFCTLAFPAIAARAYPQRTASLLLAGVLLALFVGLRFEVGGDWVQYLVKFQFVQGLPIERVFLESDPGFALLNWLVGHAGLGYYSANFLGGLIFVAGLIAFARHQPEPWVALTVAFPYLVLVVGMGYARQGIAVGFILMSLVALNERKFIPYLVYIALATLFHKTALIMIPLGFFLFGRGWLLRSLTIIVSAYVLFDALVSEDVDRLWTHYVDEEMESQGARIRVWMNFIPSAILLAFGRSWRKQFPDYWFWFWIAVGSITTVLLVGVASTAVDRIALYFIPIQIAVFTRLPGLLRHPGMANLTRYGIVAGYAPVLYDWLNYAAHARYWVPYGNVLFN
jgi:hypothetical protein